MTPTPPSTTSSHSNSPNANFRVVRKRNRVPLSCAPCRHRKLKCNRASPCDNCTKRGDTQSCTYTAPATRKKGSMTHSSASSASPDDMQNRIDRLEGLVLSLMTNGSQTGAPGGAAALISAGVESLSSASPGQNFGNELDETNMTDNGAEDGQGEESETERVTKSFGIMKVDNESKKTFYIGEAHWAALLNDIAEVRNYFAIHKKEYQQQAEKVSHNRKENQDDSGPALLFGATKPRSREEILSQIPSRYTCDILVARYFNTFDPATHILHGPTFQKQYRQHWQDPSKTTIVWIGMLFAMMRLAMISWSRDGDEPPEFHGKCYDMAAAYRIQMAHCLILADYTKPHAHIIETLVFHLHAEYTTNREAEASVWVLVGMIARMAMRMGYHRDSKLFPNLSLFQGEMRRRIWTFVRQSDLLFSFQFALPPMIRIGDSDTDLPRNIYDDEFDEDCKELPPARPPSEATPVSYMIAKARLSFGFGRVIEDVNGVKSTPYHEVLEIDRGLRDIYGSMPEHLRLRPMAEQTLAPISLIMARFALATIYHKSLCVLHRRFLKVARTNSRYLYSRRTCLDSAMTLLSFQAVQHDETRAGGRLRSLKSYTNSLTTHDFILAATIICMDLYNNRDTIEIDASTPSTTLSGGSGSRGSTSTRSAYGHNIPQRREDLIRALERSHDIWKGERDESMEAYKASELLNMLIDKLKAPSTEVVQAAPPPQYPLQSGSATGATDEQNAALTLGLLSTGGVSSNPPAPNTRPPQLQGGLGELLDPKSMFDNNFPSPGGQDYGGLFGTPGFASGNNQFGMVGTGISDGGDQMNLDWEAWDSYVQGPILGLDPASNLWSSSSNNGNMFSSISSPDSGANNDPVTGLGPNFYPSPGIESMMTAGATETNSKVETELEVPQVQSRGPFMGVSSPQPGGTPAWRWNMPMEK